MHAHSRWGSKRRRFFRRYGTVVFLAFCVVAVVALVGMLMYMLTSMNWRLHS